MECKVNLVYAPGGMLLPLLCYFLFTYYDKQHLLTVIYSSQTSNNIIAQLYYNTVTEYHDTVLPNSLILIEMREGNLEGQPSKKQLHLLSWWINSYNYFYSHLVAVHLELVTLQYDFREAKILWSRYTR